MSKKKNRKKKKELLEVATEHYDGSGPDIEEDKSIDEDIGDADCVFNMRAKDFKMGPREWFGALLMLGLLIIVVWIGIWVNRAREASYYFVTADSFCREYYDNLTSGQKITNLRVFDFYSYFLKHRQGIFNRLFSKPEVSIDEIDWHSDLDDKDKRIYERSDSVCMSYNITVNSNVSVSIVTCIDPTDEDSGADKMYSYARVIYFDDDSKVHSENTPNVPVVMTDAVFDANSPFFCAREIFESVIALFESDRLRKYPHGPFIGLSDEAAPDDYHSELIKRFLIDEAEESEEPDESDDLFKSDSDNDDYFDDDWDIGGEIDWYDGFDD